MPTNPHIPPVSEVLEGRVQPRLLKSFVEGLFQSAGLSVENSAITADVLVSADCWGVQTHGSKLANAYCKRLRAGRLNAGGVPKVVKSGPAWAIVDGDSGIATVTSAFAMNTAIALARTAGFAYVGVRNSCHFGAAAYYANLAAQSGMIGIAMANDTPSVSVAGVKGPVIGSNPIAYAIPSARGRSILFDIATSTVAGGKVFAAMEDGNPIPEGWLSDADGFPTTDPTRLIHGGALTSLGGHKGFGIAILIECLSAALTGASLMSEVGSYTLGPLDKPTGHGAAFVALNLSAISQRDEFDARLEFLASRVNGTDAGAYSGNGMHVPGERMWERWDQAWRSGLVMPVVVVQKLLAAAQDLGVHPPRWLELLTPEVA